MLIELLCGLVIFRVFRRLFYDDDFMEVDTSDTNAIFDVAVRLEKLYGGKVYVGLRIPDADTGLLQHIDLVQVTKGWNDMFKNFQLEKALCLSYHRKSREAVVICVKNLSGLVSISADGSWICEGERKHRTQHHSDPVAEAKKWVAILESYLDQRGVALPDGYLSCKVVLPNPNFRTIHSGYFPPEVVQYDQWIQLKPDSKLKFPGWLKDAFRGAKKEMQESFDQKLNFVLSTAPVWDRLELNDNKHILGEFQEFKGKHEDELGLRTIKRSKIGRLIIHKTSILGFAHSKIRVLYSLRDYRNDGASHSEWTEVTVRSRTDVLFRPMNSSRIRKFKLCSVTSMTLSA